MAASLPPGFVVRQPVATAPSLPPGFTARKPVDPAEEERKRKALQIGAAMQTAPDRIAQAFDVAARGPQDVSETQAFTEGFGDSATLGFGDELTAGLAAIPALFSGRAGDTYNINLARRRQALEAAQAQHPYYTLGGQLGGAAASPVGVGTAARGAGLGTRLLYGAGTGGLQGGLYGIGSGETPGERAIGGVTGTVVGAGLGAAAPVLTEGVIQAGRGAKYFNPMRGSISREGQAAQQVSRNLARDAGGAQNVPGRLAELRQLQQQGFPAVVGDVGGESTHAIARAAANVSPEAKQALEGATGPRFRTQNDRAATFIRSIVGNTDLPLRKEQLAQEARRVSGPAYRHAFSQPTAQSVWDHELEVLAGDPIVQSAIRQATVTGRHEAAMAGAGPITSPWRVDPRTGGMVLEPGRTPSLRFWNQVKINLDKMNTREAQASARVLRDHLDTIVPEYRAARGTRHQIFQADNALDAGKNFVTMELNNADARRAIARMSAPERAMFTEGFASQLIERIGAAKDNASVLEQAFITSPNARQRIQIALGPQRANQLEVYLRTERMLNRFREAVSGGPSTARQLLQAGLPGVAGGSLAFVSPYSPSQGSISPSMATALAISGLRYGINRSIARRVGEMLASDNPQRFLAGLKVVSRNQNLMNWIRSLDKPIAKAGAQRGTEMVQSPLRIYLNAGERDRAIGSR